MDRDFYFLIINFPNNLLRMFHVKWTIQFHEKDGKTIQEFQSEEDHIFRNDSLTARWNMNTQDMPPMSRLKTVVLFAETPVFFQKNFQPSDNRYVS